MLHIKPIEQCDAKRTRRSLMAFLEGEQNLNWIVGVIRSSASIVAAEQMLMELKGYGSSERYQELVAWFGAPANG